MIKLTKETEISEYWALISEITIIDFIIFYISTFFFFSILKSIFNIEINEERIKFNNKTLTSLVLIYFFITFNSFFENNFILSFLLILICSYLIFRSWEKLNLYYFSRHIINNYKKQCKNDDQIDMGKVKYIIEEEKERVKRNAIINLLLYTISLIIVIWETYENICFIILFLIIFIWFLFINKKYLDDIRKIPTHNPQNLSKK